MNFDILSELYKNKHISNSEALNKYFHYKFRYLSKDKIQKALSRYHRTLAKAEIELLRDMNNLINSK